MDLTQDKDPVPDLAKYMRRLKFAVEAEGGEVYVAENDRYLRAAFPFEVPLLGKDLDDVEFYFTPGDLTLQFRAERRTGRADFGENRRRLERIRQRLGWELVPVLRNRQRAFFFGESPLDKFGPALYDALEPGAEPTPYEASVLSRQGQRPKDRMGQISTFPFANDDLGRENDDGKLDAVTRDFLRATCDPNTQLCD